MHTLTETDVAALLDDLARLLPFPTTLYTDMGADSWAPQLYFGPVDPSSDLAAHRAGIDADTAKRLVAIGKSLRALKDRDLEEVASTRLLVYAATLIKAGLAPVEACRVTLVESLTDDIETTEALLEIVSATFGH